MAQNEAIRELGAVRREMSDAADSILSVVEGLLDTVQAARAGGPLPLDALETGLCNILEALSFQDITGQRITRVTDLIGPGRRAPAADAPMSLENGPALPGQGMSQEEADALLNDGGR